jgi:hypothetical protein
VVPCVHYTASNMLALWCRFFNASSFSNIDRKLAIGSAMQSVSTKSLCYTLGNVQQSVQDAGARLTWYDPRCEWLGHRTEPSSQSLGARTVDGTTRRQKANYGTKGMCRDLATIN